ncbi:hypothetical protein PVAP13_5NG087000 [Panicum virgatum]|uniref:Uncharacterized protein n=1 Tax=Panicum virgatum TaxID=38727 RepID=A0A8T0RNY3_PANVG|nr:hypothetical protein PVAP13_5NG087000 [Panicum virgatum]
MAVQWTVPVQRRAAEVERRCVRACGALADAAERLALPVHVVADAPGVRARLELVRASDDLALAACSMEAVELFAVRSAAANPVAPLASVQHVPGGDHHPLRLALSLLQSARGCAEDACDGVEWCCGHLRTADSLLAAVPALPGVDSLLDGEHFTALHDGVEAALNLGKVSTALAITAHWLVG